MATKRYCRAEEVELRSIVDENFLIVLHAGESKMFSLNNMGLWFWGQLKNPVTEADLLKTMLAEYDVTEDAAASEIRRFLDDLCGKGLVRQYE